MNADIADSLMTAIFQFKNPMKGAEFVKGLSHSEMKLFFIMNRISCESSITEIPMSEIIKTMNITKPALTQLINKLEDKELVERVIQKSDRRSTYVRLTENGILLFKKRKEEFKKLSSLIAEKMGEADTEKLIELLNKLNSIMRDINCQKQKEDQNGQSIQKP